MIKMTDRYLSPYVYCSFAAFHNVKYKDNTVKLARLIKNTLPEFRKVLNLPRSVAFRIAPFKSGTRRGSYSNEHKMVNLSCRLTGREAIEVIAHELIHAEQYHTKRLKMTFDKSKGWVHCWYGEQGSKGTTYRAYRNQPWEVEAFGRQAEIADLVIAGLRRKNEKIKSYCQGLENAQV